jgi:hypothetical protein
MIMMIIDDDDRRRRRPRMRKASHTRPLLSACFRSPICGLLCLFPLFVFLFSQDLSGVLPLFIDSTEPIFMFWSCVRY